MKLENLHEEYLLDDINKGFYFIVKENNGYNINHSRFSPDNYEVKLFTNLLSVEERKFLIAESILNSPELRGYILNALLIPKFEDFDNAICSLNAEELDKIIAVIKFTEDFNGYLSYMLGKDWITDNFVSKEDRLNFKYKV